LCAAGQTGYNHRVDSLRFNEIAAIVQELSQALAGARLEKVYAPHPLACLLKLREAWLLLDFTPGLTRVHLVTARPDAPKVPPAWVMKLRRELVGRFLGSVSQHPGDRIVRLAFPAAGRRPARTLVAELFGKHGRLLLLTENDAVLAAAIGEGAGGQAYLPPERRAARTEDSRLPAPDPEALSANREAERLLSGLALSRQLEAQRRTLQAELAREGKRLQRKATALEADLERARGGALSMRQGEALKASLADIQRGQTCVVLPDPSATGGGPEAGTLVVALDPALTPVQNMQRLFARGRRLLAAVAAIGERLAGVRDEMKKVQERTAAVTGALTLDDLARARGGPASFRPKTGHRPGPRRPYHRYTSVTGRSILVGRSGKDNHALTFQVARGSDLWLHTRDAPGAHVVVPLDKNEECDPQTLLDAATLAANGSPLKNDSRVEVTYTHAKNVHPIKGAPPGLVSVARGKTILVRLDPERIRRLLESKEK